MIICTVPWAQECLNLFYWLHTYIVFTFVLLYDLDHCIQIKALNLTLT